MPWKECSVMDEKLQFVARRLAGEAMADLCREFGISRKTGYKIFDRYQECGVQGLTDRSRRPYRYANQLPFQVENYILNEKREHPSWGAHVSRSRYSFPPGREVGWRSDRDAGFDRLVPAPHIPGSDRRFCSRSCGRYQTLGTDQPSPRRLAGAPQTAVSHPLPNTPSTASLPP